MRVLRGIAAALAGVDRGLAVFALPPSGRRPEPGWHQRCTTDPSAVTRMWAAGHNVGVGCRASDVVVLDLDQQPDVDGDATFAALCAAHRAGWPDTLTVATPHGLHLYFHAGGRPIASASGNRSPLGAGVDVRGPGRRLGGYVVGPGSVIDGMPYTVERDTAIADLPDWLAAELTANDPANENTLCPTTPPAIDPEEQ
jgi:hypothetical protein